MSVQITTIIEHLNVMTLLFAKARVLMRTRFNEMVFTLFEFIILISINFLEIFIPNYLHK